MDDNEYKMESPKIVSISNGCLQLHETTLQTFVNRIDPSCEGFSVAALSIIGPPKSGKSFYSNLLIKYLEKRTDDWLADFSSVGCLPNKVLNGFSFGNVTSGNIAPPSAESGIYIWPQPLIFQRYAGKIIVCILHIHECAEQNEKEDMRNNLHLLASLLCSGITQIKLGNNKSYDLAFDTTALSTTKSSTPLPMVCQNFINLYRIQQTPLVRSQVQDTSVITACGTTGNSTECIRSCYSNVYIDENIEPLHNEHGTLTFTTSMHSQVDKAIKFIADGKNIFPKLAENGKPITASGIINCFKYCVSQINELVKGQEQKCQNIPGVCLENVTSESEKTQLLDAKKQEYDEADITKFVEAAVSDLETDLETQLELWLKDKLNISTLSYCTDMYQRSVKKALESQKSADFPAEVMLKVQEQIVEKSQLTKEKVMRIEKIITNFHLQVENFMLKEICIDPEGMPKKLEYPIQDEDKYVMKCAQVGCSKLASIYVLQNQKILKYEIQIIRLNSERCRKQYTEVMIKYTSKRHYSPEKIFNLHSLLAKLCLTKFVTTVLFDSKNEGEATTTFLGLCAERELKCQLEKEYEAYRISNLQCLERLHNEIMAVIGKNKANYCSEMEKLLQESPNGIPPGTFHTQHKTVKENVIKNLIREIRRKFSKNEPTEGYILTTEDNIETFWTTFKRLNADKINSFKTNHNKTNEFKLDTVVDLETLNLNPEQKVAHKAHLSSDNLSEGKSEISKAPSRDTKLSPILFLFSLSEIRTYIHYNNELKLVGKFPTIVGATVDNILFYGNEVLDDSGQSKFDRIWMVSDYLFPGHKEKAPETLNIGDSEFFINTEMLLGFIMHSIKQKAEAMCQGFTTDCVITIPFWLTSTQRRRIRDSAKCAGFQNVYLVNENSAAALYFCQSTNDEGKNDIVMLSENSGCVDVAIFIYDPELKTVRMTGYCCYSESNRLVLSQLSIDHKLHLVKKVKQAYQVAQKMTDDKLSVLNWEFRARKKNVVISFQSGVWKDILNSVGKSLVKVNHGLNNDLVLNGTNSFGKNPCTKQNETKDWLSATIFRSVGNSEKTIQERTNCYLKAPKDEHILTDMFSLLEYDAIYYQYDITGHAIEIGRLRRAPTNYQYSTNCTLEISAENIVGLKRHSDSGSRTWIQMFYDETQFVIYLSIFENFKRMGVDLLERDSKKQEVLKRGKILLDMVQRVKFRSTLTRDMAVSQIKESLDILNHPKITLDDIKTQLENLKRYEAKFCKI